MIFVHVEVFANQFAVSFTLSPSCHQCHWCCLWCSCCSMEATSQPASHHRCCCFRCCASAVYQCMCTNKQMLCWQLDVKRFWLPQLWKKCVCEYRCRYIYMCVLYHTTCAWQMKEVDREWCKPNKITDHWHWKVTISKYYKGVICQEILSAELRIVGMSSVGVYCHFVSDTKRTFG